MGRFTTYKGKPILIGTIITKPNYSLLYQSRDAAYQPGVKSDINRNSLVNGDGFGVAWYNSEQIDRGACCFKFVTPAWSNQNLQNIGDHVTSNLICAHIRGHDASSEKISVNHENCHPFTYDKFTFVHNGSIPHFHKIKLTLLNLLSERFFQEIKGSTDSEHIFALILTILHSKQKTTLPAAPNATNSTINNTIDDLIHALNQTISTIVHLCQAAGIEEACSINICITDGVHIVATRYRNGPQSPPSLYYNYGSDFVCEDGVFHAKNLKEANDIVISSAPISRVSEFEQNDGGETGYDGPDASNAAPDVISSADYGSWILVPKDYMLICHGDSSEPFRVKSIELKPFQECAPYPGYSTILPRKNKPAESSAKEDRGIQEKKNDSKQTAERTENISKGSYFSKFISRPKIMKFRCKL